MALDQFFKFAATANAKCPQNVLPDLFAGLRANCNGEVTIDELNDFLTLAQNVVQILLAIGSLIAVGFVIWGGIQYILSTGDPGKIKKAKDTIVNAIAGLVITILAFGVVSFISGRF